MWSYYHVIRSKNIHECNRDKEKSEQADDRHDKYIYKYEENEEPYTYTKFMPG